MWPGITEHLHVAVGYFVFLLTQSFRRIRTRQDWPDTAFRQSCRGLQGIVLKTELKLQPRISSKACRDRGPCRLQRTMQNRQALCRVDHCNDRIRWRPQPWHNRHPQQKNLMMHSSAKIKIPLLPKERFKTKTNAWFLSEAINFFSTSPATHSHPPAGILRHLSRRRFWSAHRQPSGRFHHHRRYNTEVNTFPGLLRSSWAWYGNILPRHAQAWHCFESWKHCYYLLPPGIPGNGGSYGCIKDPFFIKLIFSWFQLDKTKPFLEGLLKSCEKYQ